MWSFLGTKMVLLGCNMANANNLIWTILPDWDSQTDLVGAGEAGTDFSGKTKEKFTPTPTPMLQNQMMVSKQSTKQKVPTISFPI